MAGMVSLTRPPAWRWIVAVWGRVVPGSNLTRISSGEKSEPAGGTPEGVPPAGIDRQGQE
jgi:hypothetical protein